MTAPSPNASAAPIGAGPDGFTTLTLGQQLEFWARATPDQKGVARPDGPPAMRISGRSRAFVFAAAGFTVRRP